MDFKSVEKKWQDAWAKQKAFEPKTDASKEKFFFTVPYPYVSGSLHVGHGRTYAVGDVVARFKRMQGFNVLWPMAFHITGTPVLAVSSKIAEGDAATIQLHTDYVSVYESDRKKAESIVASFGKDPWNIVNYYSKKLVHDFWRMGFSLDLSRQFTTGDKEYNKFVEWQFYTFKEKGYLKQAAYPLLYCVKDRNAVGEDDIKDGDSNPVDVQRFTGFKFAFGDAFLVSSTLRPDTVYGITNMFVRPDATYVRAEVDGETFIVSESFSKKLALQNHAVNVMQSFSGKDLLGKTCITPLGQTVPILPGAFVDADHATGLVHSVPAHAPFDWVALEVLKKDDAWKKTVEKIRPVSVIDVDGFSSFPAKDLVEKMKIANLKEKGKLDKATAELYKKEFYEGRMAQNTGRFAGVKASEAKDQIADWLKKEGKALDVFEASRPAECRCGGQVVAAVLSDQWFLDYNAPGWKEKSRAALERLRVHPENYKKQFQDVFDWLDKRPCARRRGLGTQLPFNNEWIIESLSDSTIYMAFYTVIKKIRELGFKPQDLSKEFFDYVFLGKGKKTEAAEKVRQEFLYWYPNDQRHTAIAHIANHLSFFVFAHTACFQEEHWPNAITLNELVVAEGTKMSKSKGNVVSLNDIAEKTGADLFRLYAISTADLGATLDFRRNDVETLGRRLSKLYAVWDEFSVLKGKPVDSPIVRWARSKFYRLTQQSTQHLEAMALRDYAQTAFFELLNAMEHFLSRANEAEKAYVASQVVRPWISLLAPVIPHAAEEYWQKSGGKGFVSHAAWPKPPEAWSDLSAEAEEDFLLNTVSDVRTVLKLVKKKPEKITVIFASKSKEKRFMDLIGFPSPEKIGEGVMESYVKKRFYELQRFKRVDEARVLGAAQSFLESQFGAALVFEEESKSQNPRKEKALPGKPAIFVE
ncbi:leucine--tRNA ligase [Candidatus Micrarchaeota archaeon]|nr:leucine--tRNA ligase [Candidatus Micrarchaeota archaeon]